MARAGIHLTGHQLAGAVATVGIRAFSAAQNAVKVLLALGGGIVVNQGVDAAAHAAHADAEEVSKIGRLCARTVGEEQVVHNQEDVGGPKQTMKMQNTAADRNKARDFLLRFATAEELRHRMMDV